MKYTLPLMLSYSVASALFALSPGDTDCSNSTGPDVLDGEHYHDTH